MDFAELWWCPGVPRKQPSCHPIWQESRFANFTHLSSQLFASFSKCLPMVLFPPFPLSVLYTTSETGSGSPPPNFLQCRWCLCRIGVWSATFDLYKRLCPRWEDLKLVQESSGQKFCPLPEIWFKGKWVGMYPTNRDCGFCKHTL